VRDRDTFIRQLDEAIEAGDEQAAPRLAQQLLRIGVHPTEITAALSRAMSRLGEKFQRLDIFVPDLLIAADAFEAAMGMLAPALLGHGGRVEDKGAVIIGVVEGDIHSLGKDLVRVMLAADGFQVHDLGRDVKAGRFLKPPARTTPPSSPSPRS